MDWSSIIGNGVGAVGSLFGSIIGSNAQKHAQERAIAAQREANSLNRAMTERINQLQIASQEKINQQQIDFQNRINDLMRFDASHAISNKKLDLQRAGYSTADPSMSGFQSASLGSPSLGSPTLNVPHVDPEFDQQGVSNIISGQRSTVQSITDLLKLSSEISLNRAHAKEADSNASLSEKAAAWSEALSSAKLCLINNQADVMLKEGQLKQGQFDFITAQTNKLGREMEILFEQCQQAKFVTQHQKERFDKEMTELDAKINELDASASDHEMRVTLGGIEKRIKEVEANMAEFGVNFNGTSVFDTIARLVVSPKGKDFIPKLQDFLSTVFKDLLNLVNPFSDGAKSVGRVVKNEVKQRVNREKSFGARVSQQTETAFVPY